MKRFIALFALVLSCALSCAPRQTLRGVPPTFTYSSITGKKIAFAGPVVLSSEIFYENRFTDQSYHSMDRNRTQEAFLRDLKQKIGTAGLSWQTLGEGLDSLVQQQLASVDRPLDSLPQALAVRLRSDSADIAVFVYAIRLYHQQSVGLKPDRSGSTNSSTSTINRSIDFICTIMDTRANRPVFHITMKKTANDNSLDFMERAIDELFGVIMR